MNVTSWAIDKNRITLVALLLIIVGGLQTYRTMPRNEDPGFIIRTATVITYFPGASPQRIEQLITDKLEKAIQQMPEIDFLSSESKTGVSIIFVNVQERYAKMRPIWDSLRRKVEAARRDLPDGVIGPAVDDEFGDVFGTIITVTGEGFDYAELKQVADQVRDELLYIDEVAKVEILGAQNERIFVEFNNARLAEIGLSPGQLQRILEQRNVIFPGGDISTGRERIVLEPTGNFESIDELRRTVIALPGGRDLIYLEDIAEIRRGYIDPPRAMMRSSGEPCLGLAISLREGGNIIVLGEKVMATIDRLQALYPIGVEFDVVAFQPEHVQRKIRGFSQSLLQAVGIVLLVMLAALGLRTGLVVASLIPAAMIMSILVMNQFGIGLDQMSLASLIISLGLLVDNAIVMSESIMTQIAQGKRPVQAAVDSAAELRVPLLTSSLTTAAAFLPIFLAESSTGEYTAPLFKVVTITLLCSWLLSLTMTPLLCVRFLRVKPRPAQTAYESPFYRRYRGVLLMGLRHPWLSMASVFVVFFVSMQGFRFVPNIFFPPNDKAIFTASFTLPPGTPIELTAASASRLETFVKDELVAGPQRPEGIVNWATHIGEGAPRFYLSYNPEFSRPEYATMIVNATSRAECDRLITRMEDFCFEHFPDMVTDIKPLAMGPPPEAPVAVRVSARSDALLFSIVDKLKARLETTAGTRNVRDDWGPRSKKLLVRINQPRARRAGVTSMDVAASLQANLSGMTTTEFREEDEVIPVILRSVAADRQDIGKLESLNVFSQATGRPVPLKQVADIEVEWEASKILRRDRLRTVTVKADITQDVTAIGVARGVEEWLREERRGWGVDAKYEMGGEIESSVEANASINAKLPVALMIIVLLLVGQFNSFRRPVIILFAIPLGLIGVVFGLLVARSYFGFMTFLGVISLAGIVINNAIVLLDRIKIEIEKNGLDPARAVVEAAQRRLRPILLTTATTMGGLLPLWFGGGVMYEPMAIAIIFGLLFATLLTLGVVPVLYALFFRVDFKRFRYNAER
ncbi:MAG: efflux RND transporter permease subunit [Candidatus Krumholzibacteria bacterium]|nr:efflux RND transporter permease subunit [Candidatus Krumholzibacteria bacterium]